MMPLTLSCAGWDLSDLETRNQNPGEADLTLSSLSPLTPLDGTIHLKMGLPPPSVNLL